MHHLETSTAVDTISEIEPPKSTCAFVSMQLPILYTDSSLPQALENHTRKLDDCPVVASEVKRCLLTQELSLEAVVEPCYLLNQRLWNSELVSLTEHQFEDCSD